VKFYREDPLFIMKIARRDFPAALGFVRRRFSPHGAGNAKRALASKITLGDVFPGALDLLKRGEFRCSKRYFGAHRAITSCRQGVLPAGVRLGTMRF